MKNEGVNKKGDNSLKALNKQKSLGTSASQEVL